MTCLRETSKLIRGVNNGNFSYSFVSDESVLSHTLCLRHCCGNSLNIDVKPVIIWVCRKSAFVRPSWKEIIVHITGTPSYKRCLFTTEMPRGKTWCEQLKKSIFTSWGVNDAGVLKLLISKLFSPKTAPQPQEKWQEEAHVNQRQNILG